MDKNTQRKQKTTNIIKSIAISVIVLLLICVCGCDGEDSTINEANSVKITEEDVKDMLTGTWVNTEGGGSPHYVTFYLDNTFTESVGIINDAGTYRIDLELNYIITTPDPGSFFSGNEKEYIYEIDTKNNKLNLISTFVNSDRLDRNWKKQR